MGIRTSGYILIILGVLAILFPFVSAISLSVAFGVIFLFAGISHFSAVWKKNVEGHVQHLVLAILYLAGGAGMILFPLMGVMSLAIILGISLIAQGIAQLIIFSRVTASNKWLLAISGGLGVLLGCYILFDLPLAATWVVGTLAGINLLFTGFTLLAISSAVPRSGPDA